VLSILAVDVNVVVGAAVVGVVVGVNLHASGAMQCPESDADQQEADHQLGDRRDMVDVNVPLRKLAETTEHQDSDSMAQAPGCTCAGRLLGAVHRHWCKGSEVVWTGDYMHRSSGAACSN
jgi:hypothetical protein